MQTSEINCKEVLTKLAQLHELRTEFYGLAEKIRVKTDDNAHERLSDIDEMSQKLVAEIEYEIRDRMEENILDTVEKFMEGKRISECGVVLGCITGIDSGRAWNIRDKFWREGWSKNPVVKSLGGLDSERAWRLRRELVTEGSANSANILEGLAGCDSDEAWDLRDRYFDPNNTQDCKYIARSLIGLDSDRAWDMRSKLFKSKADSIDIIISIKNLDSDRAWEMRRKFMGKFVGSNGNKATTIKSLAGLDSKAAWDMREKYSADNMTNFATIYSLTGIDSDRAWKIREDSLGDGVLYAHAVAISLAGLNSEQAWKMRDKLQSMKLRDDIFLKTLNGDAETSPRIFSAAEKNLLW